MANFAKLTLGPVSEFTKESAMQKIKEGIANAKDEGGDECISIQIFYRRRSKAYYC